MMKFYISHFTKLLSVTLLFGLSNQAFAQHGSVNGPVTDGSLNPASGATSFSLEQLIKAQDSCHSQMILDMLDPFLGTRTPGLNQISIHSLNKNQDLNAVYVEVKFGLENKTPIALETQRILGKLDQYEFDFVLYKDIRGLKPAGIDLMMYRKESNKYLSYVTDLDPSDFGVPYISGTTYNDYDPITNVLMNRLRIKNLRRAYKGDSKQTPISDGAQFRLQNEDHTETNFVIDREQFFKCVESNL